MTFDLSMKTPAASPGGVSLLKPRSTFQISIIAPFVKVIGSIFLGDCAGAVDCGEEFVETEDDWLVVWSNFLFP